MRKIMKKTVLIAFIALFIFKLFLSFMDYRGSSSPELHNEILKYFTQSDIIKGENYSRAGFGISLIQSIIFACMILLMSFTKLSDKLEKFCAGLSKNRLFLTSVLYIAIIYFFLTVIMLPFNFYFSYISEHNFGFSNMTMGFWFWTRLKSFMLVLIFIPLIGSTALLVIKKFKFYSVFIVPVGGLIIGFVMMILYPLVVLPLFYEIQTIDNPRLEKRIVEMAHKSGVTVDKIYVIKESDYSSHTNAFFVGFGSHKKIYLYDTLIQNNNEQEVISILAHEIGHWVYNHNMKGMIIGFFISLGVFLVMYFCVKKMQAESGFTIGEIYSPSMIPLYFLLFIIFSGFTDPVEMAVSRKMESNADYYALAMTGDPDAFISSEIRIARDNSSRLNQHPLPAFLQSSHPATIDRIKMAENYRAFMKSAH